MDSKFKAQLQKKYIYAGNINMNTTTFMYPVENIAIDPLVKFTSYGASSKVLSGLSSSQMDLYRKYSKGQPSAPMPEKDYFAAKKMEEAYQKYIDGTLKFSTVLLDKDMISKTLKKRELVVQKAQKGGIRARGTSVMGQTHEEAAANALKNPNSKNGTAVMSKSRIVSDRVKAVASLSEKWDGLESTRTRILVKMKTLQGFEELIVKLEKEYEKIKSEYKSTCDERSEKSRLLISSIQELEDTIKQMNATFLETKKQPEMECYRLEREWKRKIHDVDGTIGDLKKQMQDIDDELAELEPYRDDNSNSIPEKLAQIDEIKRMHNLAMANVSASYQKEEQEIIQKTLYIIKGLTEGTEQVLKTSDLDILAGLHSVRDRLDTDIRSHKSLQVTLMLRIDELRGKIKQLQENQFIK